MTTSAERMAALRARKREAGEPVEDREAARLRKAAWRARQREVQGVGPVQPRKRKSEQKRFLGVDGEGCGQDRLGRQHYMLLCAGNDHEQYELYTGRPLTTEECLEFIVSLPADVILTGFSFGYDATMILGGLPPPKISDILSEKERWYTNVSVMGEQRRRSFYTYWRGFGIEYLPNNYLRVCRLTTERRSSPDGKIVWLATVAEPGSARTIYESFAFFQKRFAKALTDFKIGTVEQRRMIARNKAERANFKRINREVRDYCAMECDLLAQMMEWARKVSLEVGIKPRTWNGPGKLATALHKQHGTMTRYELEDNVPSGVIMMADAAYYGGRFETPRIGRMPPLWEYDLNSAYPAAMRSLPCLEHGKWEYVEGDKIAKLHRTDRDALFVAQTYYKHDYRHPNAGPMCGLPHRQTGREPGGGSHWAGVIAWQVEGRGTYWSCEIRSAELLGAKCRFGPGWIYHRQCDCQPFAWVEALYQERKRLDALHGKNTVGYMLKLAINSLYGKLAQQIGAAPFNNPIWAGLITAQVRAQLNAAIAQNPKAICMIATDGLYSLEPLDLPVGDDLGQWEVKHRKHGLFIVQPGLYWEPIGTRRPAKKTRGFSAGWLTWYRRKRFETAWDQYARDEPVPFNSLPADVREQRLRRWAGGVLPRPQVEVPFRSFIGITLANARGDTTLARRWVDDIKTLSFDWHGKRGRHREWCPGPHVHTFPRLGGPDWISASYQAEPELAELDAMAGWELEEQPDRFTFQAEEET